MNKRIFVFLLTFLCCVLMYSQNGNAKSFPDVKVKALNGNAMNTGDFNNNGMPIVISFWATWCKPCIQELTAIHDDYDEWLKTGVKVIIISMDDARSSSKVKPFLDAKGWEYEAYLDENGDFKRAMGVNNCPHTFLLNGKKEIIWQHNSYSQGDEEDLLEKIIAMKN